MKKIVKNAASLFLSAALLSSPLAVDGFNATAFAAGDITTKVIYAEDGTAILEITPSVWENQIRYTTDGSVPTADSPLYVSTLSITKKTVVRIAEFEDGKKINGVKTTVTPKTAPVSFFVEQNYDEGTATITMDCETVGAKIYYTIDGSKPSEDSTLYTSPINVGENIKIRARAYCDGCQTKTTYIRNVKIKKNAAVEETEVEVKDVSSESSKETSEKAETKTEAAEKTSKTEKTETKTETETKTKKIVVEKDSEESSVKEKIDYKITYMDTASKSYVNLIKSKTTNYFRYTTDGSAVTKSSKKYSSRVPFKEPGVFRAKEYSKNGELVATLRINVKIKCAEVTFDCIEIERNTRTIVLDCKTPGATIYYTTDGSIPTEENGRKYDEPIIVSDEADIRAIAVKDDYKKSNLSWDIAGRIPLNITDFDFSDPIYAEAAELFNEKRYANGYNTLPLDEKLTKAACIRAKEISSFTMHTRPDGSAYGTAIMQTGVDFDYGSETYSYTTGGASSFINEIVSDKANYNGLFKTGFTARKLGIGCYTKGVVTYWVILITD